MIDFIIPSSICLTIFLVTYHLLLEKEKMHTFNRFYLLSSILISMLIPFLNFEIIKEIPVETSNTVLVEGLITNQEVFIEEQTSILPLIIWSLYGIITFGLVFRFAKNIFNLISKAKVNPKIKFQNATLVLVDEKTIPHTFLNYVFINFDDYNYRKIEDELYTHELVHVAQKHSIDILFIEVLKTLFWFNPLFYFYKKAIQLNHEFLADEEVVKSCEDIPFYQTLLLQKNSIKHVFLTSNLNYLVTKKRLIMMTKNTSKKLALLKKIAIIPIIVGMIYIFCVKIIAQEKDVNSIEKKSLKTQTEKDKIRDTYYSNVRVILKDLRNGTTIDKIYEELTLEEKRKYLSWVPDMMIENEIPELLFEKMKTKNMAVWINGKVSSKEEIKKYKRTDFSYYTYSFVHKNARTKRFPQEYQYTLYTKKYFDENLKNSHLHFSNDTIKMTVSNKKDKFNKVADIISANKMKVDTIVWYTNNKEEYNVYINDSVKNEKNTKVIDTKTEVVGIGKEVNLKEPTFPGGISEFYKFFAKNFKIPSNFKSKDKIIASFFVEKDGSLTNIEIKKDLGFGSKEEVIRVLKSSPKWIPATNNNKTVRYQYVLPILIASE
jgi:hypothetical protein